MHSAATPPPASLPPSARRLPVPPGLAQVSAALAQPFLTRIVQRMAERHPSIFARLGEHQHTDYVIDPVDLPFALHLRPDPAAPLLRAVPRHRLPPAGATISGRFLLLLELIDAEQDGDAAFFSRDLDITGDTEAVVRLRNALDDMDGSAADEAAAALGAPARAALAALRRRYSHAGTGGTL